MPDYQKFFNISHDFFCMLDPMGYYKRVNPAFFRLMGYPEDELKQHPFTYFVHPDDVEAAKTEYHDVAQGKRNRVLENRFRSSDGTYYWISWSTIVADEEGNLYATGQNITERKRLEEALEKEREENKRNVTKAIIHTQESERSKISQELHDNVNQVLTTVKLLMEISQDDLSGAKGTLARAEALQQNAINEIRSLSKRLSAPSLGNLKLVESLRELIETFSATDKLVISFTYTGLEPLVVDQYIHLAVYRILQEHLTNIVKHADADRAEVGLSVADRKLILEVKDDGRGFDPEIKSGGIGIQNMQARAESTNGSFSIKSKPGEGTTLRVSIPLG